MLLKILLVLLTVLLLLLCIPIRAVLNYREDFQARFYYLVFRYTYPSRKKKRAKKTAEEGKSKKGKKDEKKTALGGILKGKGLDGFVTLMKDITGISGRAIRFVLRHSHVSVLRIDVIVGGEDAARTAIECGYYSAVVYPAVSFLSTLITIRNPEVHIRPDYDVDKTTAAFHMHGFVWPVIVVWAACAAFFRYIRILIKRRVAQRIEQGGAK